MIEIIAAVGCLVLMTLFVFGSWWYVKRIRDGRADPIVNPGWTTDMRPASPPPPLDDPDENRPAR